jgi:hypothetical protein
MISRIVYVSTICAIVMICLTAVGFIAIARSIACEWFHENSVGCYLSGICIGGMHCSIMSLASMLGQMGDITVNVAPTLKGVEQVMDAPGIPTDFSSDVKTRLTRLKVADTALYTKSCDAMSGIQKDIIWPLTGTATHLVSLADHIATIAAKCERDANFCEIDRPDILRAIEELKTAADKPLRNLSTPLGALLIRQMSWCTTSKCTATT